VREAIEVLKGGVEGGLKELSIEISAWMLKLAKKARDLQEGRQKALSVIREGSALEKFREIIRAQQGDDTVCSDPERLRVAERIWEVKAIKAGYIQRIDARAVGEAATILGAGRNKLTDRIDHSTGILLHRVVGEYVKEGETIMLLYYNNEEKLNRALERLTGSIIYSKVKPVRRSIVYGIIT
jgi:pyrimidine-nucleoside phosphorylase